VPKDAVLTYEDVEIPPGRLIDRLRAEQDALFPPVAPPPGASRPVVAVPDAPRAKERIS
jgi:hypothetical protein